MLSILKSTPAILFERSPGALCSHHPTQPSAPACVSEVEIAASTGIQQRTVNNYLRALGDEGKVEKIGKLWFLGTYQEIRSLKLELSPEEAYTYCLGSRLFVKQHDKRNQLAETALMKLADALNEQALADKFQQMHKSAHNGQLLSVRRYWSRAWMSISMS